MAVYKKTEWDASLFFITQHTPIYNFRLICFIPDILYRKARFSRNVKFEVTVQPWRAHSRRKHAEYQVSWNTRFRSIEHVAVLRFCKKRKTKCRRVQRDISWYLIFCVFPAAVRSSRLNGYDFLVIFCKKSKKIPRFMVK